jgi:hypothetical protein
MSKFTFYSVGIVATTKPLGSDIISVVPMEQLNLADGPLETFSDKRSLNLPNATGKVYSGTFTSTVKISATWLPLSDSNRMTAPDVCQNETVMLYRYANTDQYYWTTIFREPLIRRLEHVVYAYGNLRAPLQAWDQNSSYWMLWSTVEKLIHLHTSKSDGEPYAYDIIIDTKHGSVTIKDDINNSMTLDSPTSTLTVNTNKAAIVNTQDATINASKSATVTTPVATINASSSMQVNTPTCNFSENVNIGGNLTYGSCSSDTDDGGN